MLTERELLKYLPFSQHFIPHHTAFDISLWPVYFFFYFKTIMSVKIWTKVILWTCDLRFPECGRLLPTFWAESVYLTTQFHVTEDGNNLSNVGMNLTKECVWGEFVSSCDRLSELFHMCMFVNTYPYISLVSIPWPTAMFVNCVYL